MRKFKSYFIILLLSIISFFFIWKELIQKHPEEIHKAITQEIEARSKLLEHSKLIQKLWIEGEESKEYLIFRNKCLDYLGLDKKFDEKLLRCSPVILECFARYKKSEDYNFKKYSTLNTNEELFFTYVSKENSKIKNLEFAGYLVTLIDKITNVELSIVLKDNCHENYLEQRSYAYGEEFETSEFVDYRFDNFNKHIYFDNTLVTNQNVNDWIRFGKKSASLGLEIKKGNDLFGPAVNLTKIQMEAYCAFKEKQVMLAHYFDAATFLPMSLVEKNPIRYRRSPYHWTKNKKGVQLTCNNIFTKECLTEEFTLNKTTPSWAGLNNAMGGVMEYLNNPIEPDSNLKASSFYFDKNSSWHKLGFRAYWDGEGFDLKNFDFRGLNPFIGEDSIQVGFRCMRESTK